MEFPYSEENYGTIVNIADPRPAGGDPGSSAADPHAPDLEAGAACALRLFMPVAAEHRGPLHRDPVPHQFGHHSDRRGGGAAGDRRSGPADHFLRSLPYNRPAVKHSQIFRPGDGTTDFGASHGFRGSVKITSSPTPLAAFCGSLGYSEALASTEYHISRLAEIAGTTPHLYRTIIEKDKRKFTDYIPGFDLDGQKKCTDTIVAKSSFDRKWSANTFQNEEFGLIGYLKGIGMATGAGIAGFSTTLSKETGFSAMMTFTQKQNVTINTSAITHPGTMKLWKKRISDRIIPGRPEGVMFLDPGPDTMDSGPDVLSRIVASFTLQLDSAAKRLNVLKETEKLPVSIKFDAENTYYPCEFENSGYGAVVCEVHIDKLTMIPSVSGVWASFTFPSIMDRTSLENSLRRTIIMTLRENGMDIPLSCHINIDISDEGTDDTISSVQQLARGLTLGALANAMHQAAGNKASSLPISAEEINEVFNEELL